MITPPDSPPGSPADRSPGPLSVVAPGFHQVAFVVEDLEASVRHWADQLGVGPWNVWTMRPPALRDTVYHGAPADFGLRHALAWSGPVQVELVQPLEGPSIFADQLATRGPGFNHLGRIVDDHDAAWADLITHGYTALQSARGFGASQDGVFAYFDPPEGAGPIVELISPPTERFDPEWVYPAPTTEGDR